MATVLARMDSDQRIVVSPNTVFQEIEGESVLLDLSRNKYFGLDEVGTRIWQLIQEQGSPRAVLEHMSREFEVDPQRLEADLDRLLLDLQKEGLIALEPAA